MQAVGPNVRLRAAREEELPLLSALCLRSKAVWGYDQSFLDACRVELTLSAEQLSGTWVRVAESNGAVVGLAQVSVAGKVADLQKLFVEPAAIGLGVGRLLLAWACETARNQGADVLTIDADPGAVGFYTRLGAREHGTAPSGSIPGRTLPHLRLAL